MTKPGWIRLALLIVFGYGFVHWMTSMPGESYSGPLPPLTEGERALRPELERHVVTLSEKIGARSVRASAGLAAARQYIEETFTSLGYEVDAQEFTVDGVVCANVEVELAGGAQAEEIVVIGAHYDGYSFQPAANDNATGVASTLELARLFAGKQPARTLRFVAFVNEEPPYFQTEDMGSRRYAKRCRQRGEDVVAMLSLETMGYYSDEDGSQHYPAPFGWFYPSTGNFIGFVGNLGSRKLVRRVVRTFRRVGRFPSEGAALPSFITGVGWSDQWSFWQEGYAAAMVTDTAPFRYPHYHSDSDTPDKIDFERLARVVAALEQVVADLARTP
jgi:Zn-dependent M28 family amino/carboxypeptidase